MLIAQLCPILCDPIECSLPGFPVYGILQARILESIAISFVREFFPTQGSNLGLPHCRQMNESCHLKQTTYEVEFFEEMSLVKISRLTYVEWNEGAATFNLCFDLS